MYYLEWRANGKRARESVRDKADVLRLARLKAFESGPEDAPDKSTNLRDMELAITSRTSAAAEIAEALSLNRAPTVPVAQAIFQAIELYIQQAVHRALASQTPGPALQVSADPERHRPQPGPEQSNCDRAEIPRHQAGHPNHVDEQPETKKTLIAQAVESYLRDLEPPQREPKTYDAYRATLELFRDTCPKQYLPDVNRDDCLAFIRHLYSIGNGARTAYNRTIIVLQLLKLHGITGLLKSRDMPKYVDSIREMYKPEQLEALFKACAPDEKVRYLFFLLTGERDKEVQFTTWDDTDFPRRCVRVTEKKALGFKPKDKEEREIPVPTTLLEALKEYRRHQAGANPHSLVFPTSNGRPDKKFENKLKNIAYHAGLNCGQCTSRFKHQCSSGPHCGKWFLHKFRHTFATASLENGHSIRTVQEWLGHSDLESTMAYLKYVRREDVHQMVDASQFAGLAAPSIQIANQQGVGQRSAHDDLCVGIVQWHPLIWVLVKEKVRLNLRVRAGVLQQPRSYVAYHADDPARANRRKSGG